MTTPIVVTAEAVGSAFNEAVLESAPERLEEVGDPVQRAAFLAALPGALQAIREESATVHPGVLFAPGHALASRMMSTIAERTPGESTLEPLLAGGLEVKFATDDWWGWFKSVFDHVGRDRFHPIVRPTSLDPTPIPDPCRIAVLGDWGTGLYGAPPSAATIRSLPRFDVLLHLGDVYYSGTRREVGERFLDVWPFESAVLHRALNSNHEMYNGGDAYFEQTLPRFAQEASYFALANDHWLIVGLDTAYVDHDVDAQQVAWVAEVVKHAEGRRVMLLSHQQLVSRFSPQGTKLAAHLAPLLVSGQVAIWYWGHEHRALIYDPDPRYGGLLGRCIGHSGVPERRSRYAEFPVEHRTPGAVWRRFPGKDGAPGGLVQDGENPFIPGNERDYAPHGFGMLALDGPRLTESFLLPDGAPVHQGEPFHPPVA